MQLFEEDQVPIQRFVEFLRTDRVGDAESEQAWRQVKEQLGNDVYRDVLRLMTQMDFEADEAREHWFAIQEHRAGLSRTLARDVGLQVAVCDYFLNIKPRLKDLVFVDVQSLVQKERSALVDELTGLYNRRYFKEALSREMERSARFSQPFSLLILDIDHFKDYNDTLGHQAGDRVLKELADVLRNQSRSIDHVVRYGGEEFVLILPQSETKQSLMAAERYRSAVEHHPFYGQERTPSGNLTVTIGVAAYPLDAITSTELFKKADEALYKGKEIRNRIVCWGQHYRRFSRYPLSMELVLQEKGGDGFDRIPGMATNISPNGLGCITDRPLEPGLPLCAVFRFGQEGDELEVKARVVRLDKTPESEKSYYLGLSFDLEGGEEEKILRALMKLAVPLQ